MVLRAHGAGAVGGDVKEPVAVMFTARRAEIELPPAEGEVRA